MLYATGARATETVSMTTDRLDLDHDLRIDPQQPRDRVVLERGEAEDDGVDAAQLTGLRQPDRVLRVAGGDRAAVIGIAKGDDAGLLGRLPVGIGGEGDAALAVASTGSRVPPHSS